MRDQPQRQRHGAKKKIAEGIGGLIVGSALVLLLRQLARDRKEPSTPTPPSRDRP